MTYDKNSYQVCAHLKKYPVYKFEFVFLKK